MCGPRHWFNWSLMLVMAAVMLASLPPDRIFLSADGGPTRLSMSNPKASLVIPKDDVDAGKISYRAIVPGISCLKNGEKENKLTLVGGIGGCKMSMKWNKVNLLLDSGVYTEHGGIGFVTVEMFDDGGVSLNSELKHLIDCTVVSKPNNNTQQGGNVVDFSVENIRQTCSDIAIEFDERYKLYRPPDSLVSGMKSDNTALIVCLSLGGALLLLAAIGFGLWCLWKHRTKKSMPAAPTGVKVVPAQGKKPKGVNVNSPDMPKVTAISNTHVKTTQPKPTPEVKPSKAIPKEVPKPEPCPTEEAETPLPKVIASSKKKEKPLPKAVVSSKKKEKSSKKRSVNKIKRKDEKIEPFPPMNKKYKKGKSAVFADLSKIEDYKTPASTCKTKEPNTMERSAQRNKCVEELSVDEQKPAPLPVKRVPRLQKDYDDYVCSLEAEKKQPPLSAKRQPRLQKGMDPYVSSLENQ